MKSWHGWRWTVQIKLQGTASCMHPCSAWRQYYNCVGSANGPTRIMIQ